MKTLVLSLMLALAVIGGAVTVFTVSANAVVGGPCDTSNPPAGCRLGTHNANTPPDKPPSACVAVYFQPLPPGTTPGDHQVGVYDSPPARLELYANVNLQGDPVRYYMVVDGKQIWDGDAPASMTTKNAYRLPAAAAKCVAAKRMPKPEYRTSPALQGAFSGCGEEVKGLTVVVAHAGDQRLALLYASCGNVICGGYNPYRRPPHDRIRGPWEFCSAAAF